MIKEYRTLDNGGEPFLVKIKDNKYVEIHKLEYEDDEDETGSYKFFKSYEPKKIFIGKSPLNKMTKFSGGYGSKFDGNSILLYLDNLTYVFIGRYLYSFATEHEIIELVSPVGNSSVPYSYAIDDQNNHYLMSYDFTMIPGKKIKDNDPYRYYYNNEVLSFNGAKFFLGLRSMKLKFDGQPDKEYERLTGIKESEEQYVIDDDIDIILNGWHPYIESDEEEKDYDNDYLEETLDKYFDNPDDIPDSEFIKSLESHIFIGETFYTKDEYNRNVNKFKMYRTTEHTGRIKSVTNPFGHFRVLQSMSTKYVDLLPEKYRKIKFMSCLVDGHLEFLTKEKYVELVKRIGYEMHKFKVFDNMNMICDGVF